jgi:DNA (cytosine-5)-methyltransferase 1
VTDLDEVTELAAPAAGGSLVLSVFPGVDLFGRAFELEGFCVVRGPDLIFGGDVRSFHPVPGRFDGVIGGSPCQDFSRARRSAPSGEGVAMLLQFARVVTESGAAWAWLENVAGVPNLEIPGYRRLRVDLSGADCGMRQSRLRHFQWYDRLGWVPLVTRRSRAALEQSLEPCCMASEASRVGRRGWSEFCELQGLPVDFALPGMTLSARYSAVGNGVPIPMGRVIARATLGATPSHKFQLCGCGCGRVVSGRRVLATVGCRKRAQRQRDAAAVGVESWVTVRSVRGAAPGVPNTRR